MALFGFVSSLGVQSLIQEFSKTRKAASESAYLLTLTKKPISRDTGAVVLGDNYVFKAFQVSPALSSLSSAAVRNIKLSDVILEAGSILSDIEDLVDEATDSSLSSGERGVLVLQLADLEAQFHALFTDTTYNSELLFRGGVKTFNLRESELRLLQPENSDVTGFTVNRAELVDWVQDVQGNPGTFSFTLTGRYGSKDFSYDSSNLSTQEIIDDINRSGHETGVRAEMGTVANERITLISAGYDQDGDTITATPLASAGPNLGLASSDSVTTSSANLDVSSAAAATSSSGLVSQLQKALDVKRSLVSANSTQISSLNSAYTQRVSSLLAVANAESGVDTQAVSQDLMSQQIILNSSQGLMREMLIAATGILEILNPGASEDSLGIGTFMDEVAEGLVTLDP